jgi:hypothetical protein
MRLMHLQREADESTQAAGEARLEAAELLNKLRANDMELAAAEAAREDALRQVRSDLLLQLLPATSVQFTHQAGTFLGRSENQMVAMQAVQGFDFLMSPKHAVSAGKQRKGRIRATCST